MTLFRAPLRIALMALACASVTAMAATVNLKADLEASSEVPAKQSQGHGTVTAMLNTDSNVLQFHVTYENLSGPAVAAHFHGPADPGVNAKPQVPVAKPLDSPIDGKATLTPEQSKELLDGKWYFNIHTAANPGGEIRGQLTKQ